MNTRTTSILAMGLMIVSSVALPETAALTIPLAALFALTSMMKPED